jgi:hypothetical protein
MGKHYLCLAIFLIIFVADVPLYGDAIYKKVVNGVVSYTNTPLSNKGYKMVYSTGDNTPKKESNKNDSNRGSLNSKMLQYVDVIEEQASKFNMDSDLIKAVISVESNWNPWAISKKGAKGLMQLMPNTASDMGVQDTFDPRDNIQGGSKYLCQMLNLFKGDLELALAAYNAGAGAVQKYSGIPPFQETIDFVRKVKNLFGGNASYASCSGDSEMAFNKRETQRANNPIRTVKLKNGAILFTNR